MARPKASGQYEIVNVRRPDAKPVSLTMAGACGSMLLCAG